MWWGPRIVVAGGEGVKEVHPQQAMLGLPETKGAGEVRLFATPKLNGVATVEPLHGTDLVVYTKSKNQNAFKRTVLSTVLAQGHSIVAGDFLGLGRDQVAVGWRNLNKQRAYGIKLFVPQDDEGSAWKEHWVDQNGMACENMQQADLDGDGRPEIIAAGRVSKNLKVYWRK